MKNELMQAIAVEIDKQARAQGGETDNTGDCVSLFLYGSGEPVIDCEELAQVVVEFLARRIVGFNNPRSPKPMGAKEIAYKLLQEMREV